MHLGHAALRKREMAVLGREVGLDARDVLREPDAVPESTRGDIVAFAGLYVLVSATIGVALMKESKRVGRALFPIPRLVEET